MTNSTTDKSPNEAMVQEPQIITDHELGIFGVVLFLLGSGYGIILGQYAPQIQELASIVVPKSLMWFSPAESAMITAVGCLLFGSGLGLYLKKKRAEN